MASLGVVPGTVEGGNRDFLSSLLRSTGAIGGGTRNSSQASAVGGNANVSVNPTIVNSYGGAANAAPSITANASGSPSASGSSSASGSDQLPSWLNTGAVRSMPGPQAGYVDPLTGKLVDAGSDWMIPALIGGGALLFLVMDE